MSAPEVLSDRKRRAYLWGGLGLLVLGAGTAALNLALDVPAYQKVSWLLVGFYLAGGVAGVAASRVTLPAAAKTIELGEALVVAILLAVVIRWGAVQAFKIPSGSMLETLQIGDHLLVNKVLYGPRIPYTGRRLFQLRGPRRGDIVVFAYPQDDDKDFIKRVIGEPGDVVEGRDKRIYVNGKPLDDPWGHHVDSLVMPAGFGDESRRDNFGPLTVPAGSYFVMGDNRDRSYDSRFWGVVEEARVRGKAFVLYWSWNSETSAPLWNLWERVRWRRLGSLIR